MKTLDLSDTFLDNEQLRQHLHPDLELNGALYGYQFSLLRDKRGCLAKCESGCESCPIVMEVMRWTWQSNGWRHPELMYYGDSLLCDGVVTAAVFREYVKPIIDNAALNPADFY